MLLVSQKQWMLELSNICHCVQHPRKLIRKDFWSSRNKRKPLSKQKCVLRKCCGVSQKQWIQELSNLCNCVQHPWKLTSKDFWSSRNKRKPLSKQKSCFEKMLWGISEMVNASEGTRALLVGPYGQNNLCHCVQHSSENLLDKVRFLPSLCGAVYSRISALVLGSPLAKVGLSAKFLCLDLCQCFI